MLRPEVVADEAARVADGYRNVVGGLERKRREVEAGGPTLSVAGEHLRRILGELHPGRGEQRHRLLVRECQIGRAEVEQSAAGPHRRDERDELGVAAKGELGSGRQRPDQHPECVDDVGRLELVDVVEHEDERPPDLRDGTADPRQEGRPVGRHSRLHVGPGGVEEPRTRQRGKDIAEQQERVVVAFVDPQPRERPVVRRCPLGENGRLPVAARRSEAHDVRPDRACEPGDDRIACNGPRPQARDRDLLLVQVERTGGGNCHDSDYVGLEEAADEQRHHEQLQEIRQGACPPRERALDRDVNRLGSRYFESGFGSAISSSYGCGQTHEAFTIDRVATYAEACAESNAMTSRGIVLAASEAE